MRAKGLRLHIYHAPLPPWGDGKGRGEDLKTRGDYYISM